MDRSREPRQKVIAIRQVREDVALDQDGRVGSGEKGTILDIF